MGLQFTLSWPQLSYFADIVLPKAYYEKYLKEKHIIEKITYNSDLNVLLSNAQMIFLAAFSGNMELTLVVARCGHEI